MQPSDLEHFNKVKSALCQSFNKMHTPILQDATAAAAASCEPTTSAITSTEKYHHNYWVGPFGVLVPSYVPMVFSERSWEYVTCDGQVIPMDSRRSKQLMSEPAAYTLGEREYIRSYSAPVMSRHILDDAPFYIYDPFKAEINYRHLFYDSSDCFAFNAETDPAAAGGKKTTTTAKSKRTLNKVEPLISRDNLWKATKHFESICDNYLFWIGAYGVLVPYTVDVAYGFNVNEYIMPSGMTENIPNGNQSVGRFRTSVCHKGDYEPLLKNVHSWAVVTGRADEGPLRMCTASGQWELSDYRHNFATQGVHGRYYYNMMKANYNWKILSGIFNIA